MRQDTYICPLPLPSINTTIHAVMLCSIFCPLIAHKYHVKRKLIECIQSSPDISFVYTFAWAPAGISKGGRCTRKVKELCARRDTRIRYADVGIIWNKRHS